MKIIRFADLTPRPWKNGGGTTTEIAASPDGAGFEEFDWRLSVADVASDGPFSLFPQIDRTLVLTVGNGLRMQIEGCAPLTLSPTSAPLSFPGDVAVTAALADGPVRDFNVMTRRGRFEHEVSRQNLGAGPIKLSGAALTILVSLGKGTVTFDELGVDTDFCDVAFTEGETTVAGSQEVLIVRLRRIP